MPPTADDTQQLTRFARYSMSRLRMGILFGSSMLAVIGFMLPRAVAAPLSILPFFTALCMIVAVGSAWTTYVTGPLARIVVQQQAMIAQLQRDLADMRAKQSDAV